MGHADSHHQTEQRAHGHRKQRDQRGVIARAKDSDLQRGEIIKQQHADHRHHRDRQRREKQPVAKTRGAGGTFFLRALMIATEAHAAKTGDQRQHHHHHANTDINGPLVADQLIGPVAKQKHQAIQPPEQAGCQPARVGLIAP